MGKIYFIMGKSSCGKDTIYKELLRRRGRRLCTIVPYTTRPARSGEKEGEEYHFTDEAGMRKLEESGRLIEMRTYDTFHGLWRYFTVDDGQIQLEKNDYLIIGTLESYNKAKAYFGEDKTVPILIELDDGVRLQRALNREKKQQHPKYEEMCRRFLADSVDYRSEKVAAAGIHKRFYNGNLRECLKEIGAYMDSCR